MAKKTSAKKVKAPRSQAGARGVQHVGAKASKLSKPNPNEFVITRTFNAPRQMVWDAWTKEENLREWFVPAGAQFTVVKMELKPGGMFHYAMKFGDQPEMWGKWVFREVDPPRRLQAIQSFSDKDAGITTHPMMPTWPKQTLSTMTLEEANRQTTLTLRWEPYEATKEEIASFNAGRAGMHRGLAGTLAQLDAYLAAKQK
jgi:uncharacterized protein YndB with AHSA1/START domain